MTDLMMAYENYENNNFIDGGEEARMKEQFSQSQQMQQPQQSQNYQNQQVQQQNAGGQQVKQHSHVNEGFQNSPAYELKNYEKNNDHVRRNPSYSFWDRMAIKRPEVIKLGVFALVIVLAISLERIGTHYLGKYLTDNIFTDLQEVMLRFSYPIGVFILIWIIKSL